MKKILFVAHVESHILHFHIPYLKMFHDLGWKVYVATNGNSKIPYTDVTINLPFQKSPWDKRNLIAFRHLKKLLNEEAFNIIHCHTPVGGAIARLANIFSINYHTTKMFYTAHGFHFYKGAPKIYWKIFYNIERKLAKYTDILITLNQEDYNNARKFTLKKNGKVYKVHGVGVDKNRFCKKEINRDKRGEIGLKASDFVMIYPAELSYRKNQKMLLDVMIELLKVKKDIKLILPGKDLLMGEISNLIIEKNLQNHVYVLGYRKDIDELLAISDIAVSASRQEGLPINIVEALFSNTPVIASNCRGNSELVDKRYLYEIDNVEEMVNLIFTYLEHKGDYKYITDLEKFSLDNVMQEMRAIYNL